MQLLFYKGRKAENAAARWLDRFICWGSRGRFSHVEMVSQHWGEARLATTISSSYRKERSGMSWRTIDLATGRWVMVTIPGVDGEAALKWMQDRLGRPYDYLGLIGFLLPWRPQRADRWYCSEAIATALGLPDPEITPQQLFDWARAQPDATVSDPA